MKQILYITIIALFLSGCSDFFYSDVDKKNMPATTPKLVVSCSLNPDSENIQVTLSKSVPLYVSQKKGSENTDANLIKNAKVEISDGVTKIAIPYVDSLKSYAYPANEKMKIVAGKTYSLNVWASEFENVSATTTVPIGVPEAVKLKSIDTVKKSGSSDKKVRYVFEFKDIPAEANVYNAILLYNFKYVGTKVEFNSINCEDFVSDQGKDGDLLQVSFLLPASMKTGTTTAVRLFNMDVHYKMFLNTLKLNQEADEENPFTEPVIVYSNINKGLGIFGSYRLKETHVQLKK